MGWSGTQDDRRRRPSRSAWRAVGLAVVSTALAIGGFLFVGGPRTGDPETAHRSPLSVPTSERLERTPTAPEDPGGDAVGTYLKRWCPEPHRGVFDPVTAVVPGVVRESRVLALPRDGDGVPGTPPIQDGASFAWDRYPGLRPGSPRGNVLLNAHTWSRGTALGNRLLAGLFRGGLVVLESHDGARICYRVVQRVEVKAEGGYPPYYDQDGPAQLALIVCSGDVVMDSDGSGTTFTHRTIWFARPVDGASWRPPPRHRPVDSATVPTARDDYLLTPR